MAIGICDKYNSFHSQNKFIFGIGLIHLHLQEPDLPKMIIGLKTLVILKRNTQIMTIIDARENYDTVLGRGLKGLHSRTLITSFVIIIFIPSFPHMSCMYNVQKVHTGMDGPPLSLISFFKQQWFDWLN